MKQKINEKFEVKKGIEKTNLLNKNIDDMKKKLLQEKNEEKKEIRTKTKLEKKITKK